MRTAKIVLTTTEITEEGDAIFRPECAARGERQLYMRLGSKGLVVSGSDAVSEQSADPAESDDSGMRTAREAIEAGLGPSRRWSEKAMRAWCFVKGLDVRPESTRREIVKAIEGWCELYQDEKGFRD